MSTNIGTNTPLLLLFLLCVPVTVFSANCGDLETQSAMNQCAYREYQQVDKELNEFYNTYRTRLNERQKSQIKEVQLAWVKFRDLACDFESSGVTGGSAYPFILQSCLTAMSRARLAELKYLANCREGDLSCPAWQ